MSRTEKELDINNVASMMRITETIKNNPRETKDCINREAWQMSNEGLKDVILELLTSLEYHVGSSFYGDLFNEILGDVQTELDEKYEEQYEEYHRHIEELNRRYAQ